MSAAVTFRRDIQGLRAIAVLSVVLFHASAGKWLTGGFVGVDIFFVISGFLITRILLKDDDRGQFSLIAFYQRRIRRLFPALLTVLFVTLVAGAVLLSPDAYRELGMTTTATLLFASNFVFLALSGYFDGAAELKPLLHTWSLAVEEQFYILFPILLYLLRRFARRALTPVLVGLGVVSLCASIWLTAVNASAAFYLAPPRACELLLGALLACHSGILSARAPLLRDALSLLGLVLIAASVALIDSSSSFPGSIALIPCVGTALVIAAGQDKPSLGGRMISSSPFVMLGDISYSLYLWHWPLLALGRHWTFGALPPAVAGALAVLAVLIGFASRRWIEQPFIEGFPKLRVITAGLASIAAVSVVASAIYVLDGLPGRFSKESQQLFAAGKDSNRERARCHSELVPIPYDSNCVFGAPGSAPSVAIWADSHGAELSVALGKELAHSNDAVMQITASACPPLLGYSHQRRPGCPAHNTETARRLAGDERIRRVLILINFARYAGRSDADLQRYLVASTQALMASGKQVVLFEPIPTFEYEPPAAVGLIASRGGDPSAWGQPRSLYRKRNERFIALIARVAQATGAQVVHTASLLCSETQCPAYANGEVMYFNVDHLSVTGAAKLAKALPEPTVR